MLAKFPELGFFTEEEKYSYNLKYFSKDNDYVLTLDPINGTRFYKDGLLIFDIIITILHRRKIEAAVAYIPVSG